MGVVSEIVSERAVMGEQKELYDARAAVWRDVLRQIAEADIANMTPMQALNLLSEMQMRVQEFLRNPVDYVGKKSLVTVWVISALRDCPKPVTAVLGVPAISVTEPAPSSLLNGIIHPVIVPNHRQSRRLGTT